jgi:hypothetical protein
LKKYSLLFSSCIPAEEEPVLTNTSYCQPLIKLDKPFCEHYGFKLDKYVNVSVGDQQYWNDRLWKLQEQYDQIFVKRQNRSISPKCIDQFWFAGCHYTFPGCERSTSVFKPKKFCKVSCLHFTNECSMFATVLKDIYLSGNPGRKFLFSCLKRPSRNAGDSPECVYYERKESLEKEGMLVGRQCVVFFPFSSEVNQLASC